MAIERQVALIRGINVGRSKRIAMQDLRALLEKLGFTNVKTLLNSGNAVFTSTKKPDAAAKVIARGIAEQLGVTADVVVLGVATVADILQDNPLRDVADEPARLLILVYTRPDDAQRLKPLLAQDWAPERIALGVRAAYLWCANGIAQGALAEAVAKTLKASGTSRNLSTMEKILAALEG